MTRDDDPVAGEVKIPISFVVAGVPQEDTQ
jgi:hypothetical protein